MDTFQISDEAVDAAAKAVYGGDHLDGSPQRDAWLRDFRMALEAAAPYMLADAWNAGAQVAFDVTREGFNGECAFEHCADDDYPPPNPYSGQPWLVDGGEAFNG